jgi:hypothetical protein
MRNGVLQLCFSSSLVLEVARLPSIAKWELNGMKHGEYSVNTR